MASRRGTLNSLRSSAPSARHTEQQLQPKLKPQLQHKLLRSLRSLRPRCLRSPCSEGANRSPRYARKTICPFFAFSGVWQLFAFCLLVRSSLKGRKRKAAKIICRLRSPHTCMASRGAEASKLGPPLYIAMQTRPCSFDNRFYIIVYADNNDYRLFPPFPPSSSYPLFLSSWWAPASYFGRAHQHRQADPHPPPLNNCPPIYLDGFVPRYLSSALRFRLVTLRFRGFGLTLPLLLLLLIHVINCFKIEGGACLTISAAPPLTTSLDSLGTHDNGR